MSACGTRSPRLSGHRHRVLRIAVVVAWAGALAWLTPLHAPAAHAKTEKLRKVPARPRHLSRIGHHAPPKYRKQPIAQRRSPIRVAKRALDPAKLIIPQGDGSPILASATRFLGRPYRFGSEHGAFDCSGFVRTVFAKVDVDLPHSAHEQFALGERVRRNELEPGDLVFFRNARRGRASHVGIYVGEDKFVHAASRSGRVQVDSLSDTYYTRHYLGARRLEI